MNIKRQIAVGERVPNITLTMMADDDPETISSEVIFSAKKVVLFAVPGAFTPTCSKAHLPSYITYYDAIKDKGIDTIACLSVNDAFVMGAWAKESKVKDILMLADGNGSFTRAMGLEWDLVANNMGMRSHRYAMVVDDGVIKHLQIEAVGEFKVSSAERILQLL